MAVLAIVLWLSDKWWPATVLMFAPRAVFLLPLVVLAAIAGWQRRQALWWVHGATALVVLLPIMGFSLPFGRLLAGQTPGFRVRMLTLNQGKGSVIPTALIGLIEHEQVQVVCFQEHFDGNEGVADPVLEQYFSSNAWHRNKERSIASRLPIVEELPPLEDADAATPFWRARVSRARLRAPSGTVFTVASVHMPTMYYAFGALQGGRLGPFKEHIAWRARRMGLVAAALASVNDLPLLVGGDFNMPSDSTLMGALEPVGLSYAFDSAGRGFGYTRPSTFPWVRIDHILGGPEWTFTRCWTGPDVGSDHLPLLAEAVLTEPSSGGAAAKVPDSASRPVQGPAPGDPATTLPEVPKPAELKQSSGENAKKTETP